MLIFGYGDFTHLQWASYAFADKIREKARLAALEALQSPSKNFTSTAEGGIGLDNKKKRRGPVPSWSNKVEARERRDLRREKKKRKRAFLQVQAQGTAAAAAAAVEQKEDAQDLMEEQRAAKRVKKGRMATDDFALQFGETE